MNDKMNDKSMKEIPIKNQPAFPGKPSGGSGLVWITILLAAVPLSVAAFLIVPGCNFSFTGMDFDFTGEKVEKQESGEIGEAATTVSVINQYGDVRVEVSDSPGWTWDLATWGDTKDLAQQLLDQVTLEVTEKNGVQTWELKLPDDMSDYNGLRSTLVLNVPASVAARVNNRHGATEVLNVEGEVDIVSAHGDVSATGLTSVSRIENRHGELSLNNVAGSTINIRHGNVRVDSANGDLAVDAEHGDVIVQDIHGALTVKNGHGDIKAANIIGDSGVENRHGDINLSCMSTTVHCISQHGNINIEVNNPDAAMITVENAHGDIELYLPETMVAKFETSASHGDVSNEFENSADSSVVVKLETSHDDIVVKKHKPAATPVEVSSESSQ